MTSEVLVLVALALRACTGPVCCWEVRLDDGRVFWDEQGAEARLAIPRQGPYFDVRATEGTCSNPGLWSDWSRFAWLHPTDLDADGVVGGWRDVSAVDARFRQLGEARASDYSYCLPAEPWEP